MTSFRKKLIALISSAVMMLTSTNLVFAQNGNEAEITDVTVENGAVISAYLQLNTDGEYKLYAAVYEEDMLCGLAEVRVTQSGKIVFLNPLEYDKNTQTLECFVWKGDTIEPASGVYKDGVVRTPAPTKAPAETEAPIATATPTAVPTDQPTPTPTGDTEGDGVIYLLGDSVNADGVENVTVSGTTVTITAAGEYTIKGTLNEGQIKVAAASSDDEITINLDNANVTNTTDDAFTSSKGEVMLVPMADTENSFNATADGACAIYGKHNITVKGEGKLTANSEQGNGIRSKKNVEIGVCDLVVNAGNNGIKGDKSVKITKKNKSVTIVSNGDGIKSDFEPELVTDDTSGETTVEGGTVKINGGTINITTKTKTEDDGTASTGDGIQADMLVEIKGGTININATGEAIKANASSIAYLEDETATEGTPADGDGCVVISGGTITASAGEDAIKAVKNVTISDSADITITKSQEGIQVKEILYTDSTETTVLAQVEGSINIDGGKINITSSEDGIQCGTGNVIITDGTITVNSVMDSIQAENVMYITGGIFDITAHGGVSGTSTEDSCKGIKAKNLVKITGGTFDIDSYDDAIHSNHTVRISGGDITAATTDDGVHGDSYLYISDNARINITNSYEGIEAAEIYITGGETYLVSSDDGANAAGEKPTDTAYDFDTAEAASVEMFAGPGGNMGGNNSWNNGPDQGSDDSASYGYLKVSGGLLYIEAEGDGFDSNGSALIEGGTVLVNGPTSGGNGVFDIGDSSDSKFTITGGIVVGAGIADMAVTPDSSTQYYVLSSGSSSGGGMQPGGQNGSSSGSLSIEAGKALQLTDSSGNAVMTYVPSKKTSWLFITTPEITSGTYTLSYGGSVSGGTYTKGSYGIVTGGTYSGGSTKTLTATK